MSKQNTGKKTLLDKIKQAFAETFPPPAAPVADPAAAPPVPPTPTPITNTLADGRVITIDKKEVGGIVMIDGQPAPSGDYTLEDGSKITVGEAGAITAITPSAPSAPAADAIDMTTDAGKAAAFSRLEKLAATPEDMGVMIKALMEYCFGWEMRRAQEEAARSQAIEVYKTSLSEHKTKLQASEDKVTKLEGTLKQLFTLVQELAEIPQADPPGPPKTSTNSDTDTVEDKFRAKAQAFKSLRDEK